MIWRPSSDLEGGERRGGSSKGLSKKSVFCHATVKITLILFSFIQGAKTGKDNGYTMLFDIESFDYSYYDEGSEGLKVALVHHLDMPIMRQTGFHVAPGSENQGWRRHSQNPIINHSVPYFKSVNIFLQNLTKNIT
jgi:hypothetical protein